MIQNQLQIIGNKIEDLLETNHREPYSAKLLAVSKHHPSQAIQIAYTAGQRAFGENYAQEMGDKAEQLADLDIEWHFIGPIQSNKTKLIANTAHWVHSVDRFKIARRLSEQKPDDHPDINICLQVNIDNEATKSGILLNQLEGLAAQVSTLAGLKLRGLMAIPMAHSNPKQQAQSFAQLRKALENLNQKGYQLDTLSMGMSNDMPIAIAEGATIVRIGTAIFGQRID
ncbi:MAG: YggS family pyridoxal phosphate-dependent enzyme [Thiotrichaceae bacterium]|nr:YggS family pyridoxal phosphate-dependent enzyme [Thiotrichaceae bacterium]